MIGLGASVTQRASGIGFRVLEFWGLEFRCLGVLEFRVIKVLSVDLRDFVPGGATLLHRCVKACMRGSLLLAEYFPVQRFCPLGDWLINCLPGAGTQSSKFLIPLRSTGRGSCGLVSG